MIIATIESIPNFKVIKVIGTITVSDSRGADIIKDYKSKIADLFGSKAKGYTSVIDEGLADIYKRLSELAKEHGGNAVLGLRFAPYFKESENGGLFMLIAYGTVVLGEEISI